MAKTDYTKQTTPQVDRIDLDKGNIRATGVGLRENEITALDNIGAELGELIGGLPIARNALIRIAVRMLIEAVWSGEIKLADLAVKFEVPEKPKPRLKL